MNVLEIKSLLRIVVGVSRMGRVSNEEVRRRAGTERALASRVNQRVLHWLRNKERMDEKRMSKRVRRSTVCSEWLLASHLFGLIG